MFFNPTVGFFALLFISVVLILMTFAAHVIWLARLSLSPVVSARPRLERVTILSAAFVVPVVSFYVIEISCWWRKRQGRVGPGAFLPLGLAVMATFAVVAFGITRVLMRPSPANSSWSEVAGLFLEQSLLLAVPQILLFMIFRSFAPDWRHVHVASTAAVLLPFSIVLLAG
jgi:hypothetical protein